MGNYRWLMIYFSCFAMFFSIVDAVTGPFVHSYEKSFCVLADRTNWKFGEELQYLLICVLCGCFGVTITFFAIHFVFRYFALERQGRLSYFHGCYFIVWLTIPILFGTLWGMTIAFLVGPDEEKTEYLRESIMSNYNLSMENITYVGSVYFRKNAKGEEELVVNSMIAILIFTTMMGTSFAVVCYYGYLSYKRITSLIEEGESSYTRNLQRQLYKALVVQAIIPIVLMYLPVGNYLILPVFGVNISPFSKLVTFLYAAYPAVDPLPLMFIIDNYRNAIADFFYCCSSNKNRVTASEDEISRGQTTI
ncbi:hypothetical protein GCK72_013211 [Caenorhabditis remanei]|uniref:Serpentine receptor class r-10 n=1 Tax=Caenorhabditis remanei TaxID=31234 RepID=A0A6A5GN79_CAERE|nr:hypothetical protein GCK72_013211 [Caenorhabditis remanei]KAF1756757.1 hypothetical protein GCK72_013211 [Caenorhabditis remanei]